MPIQAGVSRVELNGHGPGGEIFSTGFWLSIDAADEESCQIIADTCRDQLEGPTLVELASLINADSGYDEVRVASYTTGGPSAEFVASSVITDGVGTNAGNLPLQQSMCITLRTAFAGRSRRGRMYLPANGIALGAGHVFSAATCGNVCTALGEYFQALNISFDPGKVIVESQTLGSFKPVTELATDQVPDIQRRRANRQPRGTISTFVL